MTFPIFTRVVWPGIILTSLIAVACMWIWESETIKSLGISPLIIGILVGMVIGNFFRRFLSESLSPGIRFSAKQILRTAVVLYGFRITFQEISEVGLNGVAVSFIMVFTTFFLGSWIGKKFFGLDQETAMLTSSGSSICGAAAVLATESVLKSDPAKSAMAVATVVLFGTISMFVFPLIYSSGITGFDAQTFGIYIGGSVHEVAQVVASGNAVSVDASKTAVIVKMTRVILLAPLLIVVGLMFKRTDNTLSSKVPVPIFVWLFIAAAALNSLNIIPETIQEKIIYFDTFLLTIAMTALGIETYFSKFKNIGAKPFYLAGVLFIWLVLGGGLVTKLITSFTH